MPLNHQDYMEIVRHLQTCLRESDREVFELLSQHVERAENAQVYLLNYLRALIHVASERSGGTHGRILDLLNNSVSTATGKPVGGIRILLSPQEQELYQRQVVDLVRMPDRAEFVSLLRELYFELSEESGREEGLHDS
jgi:hypothetical protein